MRTVLLAAAALAALIIPASLGARSLVGTGVPNAKAPPVIGAQGGAGGDFRRFACDGRGDRRHGNCAVVVGSSLGYLDYGDFDGNRSFDPDRWNDWWHDRPDRAYPAWIRHNQNCTPDRMWWSGSGWHC